MDQRLQQGLAFSSAQKRFGPSKEAKMDRVASAAASASLRSLPRYLPWQRFDALHPSAPDTTRIARLNQCFLKGRARWEWDRPRGRSIPSLTSLNTSRETHPVRADSRDWSAPDCD